MKSIALSDGSANKQRFLMSYVIYADVAALTFAALTFAALTLLRCHTPFSANLTRQAARFIAHQVI